MRILKLAAAAMLGVASIGLAGCATGFPAKVSRYQAMPAPAGQSFYVLPFNGSDVGGLEFTHYASMVRQAMIAQGYAEAPTPAAATMLVRLGYGVDLAGAKSSARPITRIRCTALVAFTGALIIRAGATVRSGFRSPFYYGWDDPYWWGRGSRQLHGIREPPRPRHPSPRR